jgi:hypothetical protein
VTIGIRTEGRIWYGSFGLSYFVVKLLRLTFSVLLSPSVINSTALFHSHSTPSYLTWKRENAGIDRTLFESHGKKMCANTYLHILEISSEQRKVSFLIPRTHLLTREWTFPASSGLVMEHYPFLILNECCCSKLPHTTSCMLLVLTHLLIIPLLLYHR